MSVLLLALGLMALVLPGLCPSLTMRGNPHWLVPLDVTALALGMVSIAAGLSISVGVGVLHLVERASLAQYEGHLAPGGIVASGLAATVLTALAWRVMQAGRRAQQGKSAARAERWLGDHRDRGDHELVLLPTSMPIAYSVPGSPPQVVVSQGLKDLLEADLFAFLIDHERAHLSRRHRLALLVAASTAAVLGGLPAISRSTLALRLCVERAADEDAAGRDPQRRRHLAAAMNRLRDAYRFPPGADDSIRYRAATLASSPAARWPWLQVSMVAGLVVLSILVTAVAGHVGDDLPGLLAALR